MAHCWASWPTPRITQPVRSRPTSMTCKRNGAVKVAWRLLVRYSVRLQRRLNSDRKSFEIFLGLDVEKGWFAAPWVELRRLLSESQSSSSERRRTHGTPKMNSWRFFEGSSTSAIVRRQRPAPGQVMLHQQQLEHVVEQAASFLLACQYAMTSTQDRTTTYRVTTCATATRLSLVVWHVWRFLVRYNNRGRRRRVDQNDHSFLSFFFHF